jgi:hypothetical protein
MGCMVSPKRHRIDGKDCVIGMNLQPVNVIINHRIYSKLRRDALIKETFSLQSILACSHWKLNRMETLDTALNTFELIY